MSDFNVVLERLLRFSKHLPRNANNELIILKGHLLIEELLSELINKRLKKTNPLKINLSNNMMFNQKLNICWALYGIFIDVKIWDALKQLNNIRNSLAHSLEPKSIEQKIKTFNNLVISYADLRNEEFKRNDLEYSISLLFTALSAVLEHKKVS